MEDRGGDEVTTKDNEEIEHDNENLKDKGKQDTNNK